MKRHAPNKELKGIGTLNERERQSVPGSKCFSHDDEQMKRKVMQGIYFRWSTDTPASVESPEGVHWVSCVRKDHLSL